MDVIGRLQFFSVYVWAVYGCAFLGAALLAFKRRRDLKTETARLKTLEAASRLRREA